MKTKIFFLSLFILAGTVAYSQDAPESAGVILSKAYKQAAKEKKNVFVIFHASWCGWCKKIDASVEDPSCSDYFNKNYVFVHLTIMENGEKKKDINPGAEDMYKKYFPTGGGIPVFLIFDKKGTLLGDSQIRKPGEGLDKPGQNMGCPAADDEVAAFVNLLKKTSKISDVEAAAVTERFKKNSGSTH
jgi:thioredoxin-related protein